MYGIKHFLTTTPSKRQDTFRSGCGRSYVEQDRATTRDFREVSCQACKDSKAFRSAALMDGVRF